MSDFTTYPKEKAHFYYDAHLELFEQWFGDSFAPSVLKRMAIESAMVTANEVIEELQNLNKVSKL